MSDFYTKEFIPLKGKAIETLLWKELKEFLEGKPLFTKDDDKLRENSKKVKYIYKTYDKEEEGKKYKIHVLQPNAISNKENQDCIYLAASEVLE